MKLQHLALLATLITAPAWSNTDRPLSIQDLEASLSMVERDKHATVLSKESISQSARESVKLMKRAGFRVLRGGGQESGTDAPQGSEVGYAILATNNPGAELISLNYELAFVRAPNGNVTVTVLQWRLERTSTIRPAPGATIHN